MAYPYHDTMVFSRGMGAMQAQIDALEGGAEFDDSALIAADAALDARLDVVEPLVTAHGTAITANGTAITALQAKSPTTIMKTGNTDFTDATLANDGELVLALGTGTFDIDVMLLFDGTTANDAKCALTFSGTATIGGAAVFNRAGAASTTNTNYFYDSGLQTLAVINGWTGNFASHGTSGQGVPTPFRIKARIIVTVAGNLRVQAAKQNNTDTGGGANATRLLPFSNITAFKVA